MNVSIAGIIGLIILVSGLACFVKAAIIIPMDSRKREWLLYGGVALFIIGVSLMMIPTLIVQGTI